MSITEPRSETAARALGEHVEELARLLQRVCLHTAGGGRLLELASLAAMQAVSIEHALAEPPRASHAPEPAPLREARPWRPSAQAA